MKLRFALALKSEKKLIVLKVVNTAYKVEIGSEGIAFKNGDRLAVKLEKIFH